PSPGRAKPYRERESFLSPNWIYYDALGREIWEDEYHRLRRLPPREVSVGIVDETLALPQLGSTVINAIAGKDVVGTPEFAERASANVQQMNDVFRENLNIPYSDSLKDLELESLGIMLGQLPVAGFGLAKSAGSGVGAAAKKIFGSPLEWFAPIIDPTVANYAVGTGAGALIQKYLPEYIESRDPNMKAIRALESFQAAETDEERAQIAASPEFQRALELLEELEAEESEPDPDEDGENEFQSFFSEDGTIGEDTGFEKGGNVARKAKGGRIKDNRVPRKFTATFDDREGFVIQGVGDSPEEAVGKIRAELERLGENAEGLMREHGVEVRQETLHAKGGKVVQGLKDSDLE